MFEIKKALITAQFYYKKNINIIFINIILNNK